MKAIVLAAGKGSRLSSDTEQLPKVLRKLHSIPLLGYVLNILHTVIPVEDTIIVVGYGKERIIEEFGNDYTYAVQEQQLGTGHAVACAEIFLRNYTGDVMVMYGDMPLFSAYTLSAFQKAHRESSADCTIMTAIYEKPPAYGRIVRNKDGVFTDIIEEADCSKEQKCIGEVNVGMYIVKSGILFSALKKIHNSNAQGEYYLTDMPQLLLQEERKVITYVLENSEEACGVNTIEDLTLCEQLLLKRNDIAKEKK